MGFLGKIFGGEKEYPSLAASSQAAKRLEEIREPLASLASKVSDPIEVIPGDGTAYVFIGKPPKQFGIAWIQEGKVHNFKKFVEEKGVPLPRFQVLSDKLRQAYERSQEVGRYSMTVANRKITVTPSDSLGQEVGQIIREVAG